MDFKLLSRLFKIGAFLALTPANLKIRKIASIHKVYILVIASVLALAHIYAFYANNFFLRFIHIKVVLCFMDGLTLYGITFYTMIISGLNKRQEWKNLMNNLKAGYQQNNDREKTHFWIFLVILLHILTSLFVCYVGYVTWGVRYFPQEGVAHILIFLDFYIKLVLSVIIQIIHQRYQHLTALLTNYLSTNGKLSEIPETFMKKIQFHMCHLKRTVDDFNGIFSSLLFLIICFTTLRILNKIDFALFFDNLSLFDNTVLNGGLLIWIFVGTAVLIMMCDFVGLEAKKILSLSYDLRWCFTGSRDFDDFKFEEFSGLLEKNLPRFSAANFFDVGRTTILSLLGTVVTFLIVMIQFNNQNKEN